MAVLTGQMGHITEAILPYIRVDLSVINFETMISATYLYPYASAKPIEKYFGINTSLSGDDQ